MPLDAHGGTTVESSFERVRGRNSTRVTEPGVRVPVTPPEGTESADPSTDPSETDTGDPGAVKSMMDVT